MSYFFAKTIKDNFDSAILKTTEALKSEGFGVLTEIDMQATLKKKLNVEMPKYKILGACNPPFAYNAVMAEEMIGTMLPCNVVVKEQENGTIKIAAVDPVASMMAIKNEQLGTLANQVRDKLERVIQSIS